MLIPRHSEFRGRANSEARNRTEQSGIPRKNEVLRNSLNTEQNNFLSGWWKPILNRFFWIFLCMYFVQHCFICCPADSIVSEDVGIEPRTVSTSALAIRRSSHSATSHPLSTTSHPHSATSHPHSATSHPLSATSHPHSATSQPHSATSRPNLTASTGTLNLNIVRD